MNLTYSLKIKEPHQHLVEIIIKGKRDPQKKVYTFFLPSWSPGSYLMREYAKNIRWFKAETAKGEPLHYQQVAKGQWSVDWSQSDVQEQNEFEISYAIYCHELTVRTSHVDASHAFIHGPSVFMGIKGEPIVDPQLCVDFTGTSWTKISTGLRDISTKREEFVYTAEDYDSFIDAPLEIGNQETDGFQVEGKNHELAFYGACLPHDLNLKEDIKTIVEYISQTMGDIPYDKYTFITHFIPGQYGGLEHLNSTALIFDGTRLNERKRYIRWLELVAHEYFHTWNVKRIRPRELGPFNYTEENYTRMLWLAEGLTSFMDQLFIYQSGLMSLEEYMEAQKENINSYNSIPGRKFHSLEESSFNAWIKLYRPDENTRNSTISYYLKGGIAFFILHILFHEKDVNTRELLKLLWDRYKENPEQGMESEEVYQMVEKLAGHDVRTKFQDFIEGRNDPDFEQLLAKVGVAIEWEKEEESWLGIQTKTQAERLFIESVMLDSPAYKDGLNAGDEILAINSIRVTKDNYQNLFKNLRPERYEVLVARCNVLQRLTVVPCKKPREIKQLKIVDENLATSVFS